MCLCAGIVRPTSLLLELGGESSGQCNILTCNILKVLHSFWRMPSFMLMS